VSRGDRSGATLVHGRRCVVCSHPRREDIGRNSNLRWSVGAMDRPPTPIPGTTWLQHVTDHSCRAQGTHQREERLTQTT